MTKRMRLLVAVTLKGGSVFGKMLLCTFMLSFLLWTGVLADAEENESADMVGGALNQTWSGGGGSDTVSREGLQQESGPADSHEAMGNHRQQINSSGRQKRSYEFLMALINNNSTYQVTRVEPSPQTPQIHQENDPSSNTMLIKMMADIAAHPDRWDKLHHLLVEMDEDILASKKLLYDLQSSIRLEEGHDSKASTSLISPPTTTAIQKSDPKPYPNKNFAYHRVTGRPQYLHKNPKAYVAVSVAEPKTHHSIDRDIVEEELKNLKPSSTRHRFS